MPGAAPQRGLARLDAAIRGRLDPSVHDLGASLDAVPGPVFSDTVHLNERGAAAVAAAMYADARQMLSP